MNVCESVHDADHTVAGNQLFQLRGNQELGALRTQRQTEVTNIRGAVVDAHFDIISDNQPELAHYTARIAHRALAAV